MDKIYSVNGPVVKVADTKSFAMQEMVYVGKKLVHKTCYIHKGHFFYSQSHYLLS